MNIGEGDCALPHLGHGVMLPRSCERALLERFLKAEAMALWSVRAGQASAVPSHVRAFLRRHEQEEQRHLKQFELLLGTQSLRRARLPRVPRQWGALAVHLYGYEVLGLEFARLLAHVRPDLTSILEDEAGHVDFFERELKAILARDSFEADAARRSAQAWWNKLARTLARYLADDSLAPYRDELTRVILAAIEERFVALGLLGAPEPVNDGRDRSGRR
jgi:hypothetical protein